MAVAQRKLKLLILTEFVLFLGDPKHLGKNTKTGKSLYQVSLEISQRSFSPRAGAAVWAPQPVDSLCRSPEKWLAASRGSAFATKWYLYMAPTHKQRASQAMEALPQFREQSTQAGTPFEMHLLDGGRIKVFSFHIWCDCLSNCSTSWGDTPRPSAQYINTNDTTSTANKCTWITLSGMLSLSKLNKRSKSALGSCKISWQLLFVITHSIRVSVAVTSWGPKFRPSGWFPNSHQSSSLVCLDHFSSPWAQKMEASFDTNLAQQYFTQTRFSKGSTGFSWNLNDKYKDMQMIFNTC